MSTATAASTPVPAPRTPAVPSRWLVSPTADSLMLIGSPLIALAVVAAGVFGTADLDGFVGMLVLAHVAITLVHTHGNPGVFRAHPWRFTLVPLAALAALVAWPGARVAALVAVIVWDVHHSGMQTFGLARLYARRAGCDPRRGRVMDLLLNHLLYAGPVLAGAGLALHVEGLPSVEGVRLLDLLGLSLADWGIVPRAAVVGAGIVFVAAWISLRMHAVALGEPWSPQAVVLLASTGLVSVLSWGFNSFGLALATMKLFHCVQYFCVVAHFERRQLGAWLGMRRPVPIALGLVLLGMPALLFGACVQGSSSPYASKDLAEPFVLTLTLAHFWYDGFTWSARAPVAPGGGAA